MMRDSPGYTGYTIQLVVVKGGPCMFCMSPQPHCISLENYEIVAEQMEQQATDNRDDWRYWYDSSDWRWTQRAGNVS